MAVGWPTKVSYVDGDVYSAQDVNDSNGTINLLGSSVAYAAGKNKIINGDFRVSQRGTTFTNPASNAYTLDRWATYWDGTGATRTISQQTFTPGTAPVAGYEGANFLRYAQTVAGTSNTVNLIYQRIEDVRTLAGSSATLTIWLKADSARTVTAAARQYFGVSGSADVNTNFTGSASVTTAWQRFTFTIAVPSISGKTIGTSSALEIQFFLPAGTTPTIDFWGAQLEIGTATAFQTATGTIPGELAACQRYYFRTTPGATNGLVMSTAYAFSSTIAVGTSTFPVTMRVTPTSIDSSDLRFVMFADTAYAMTSVTLNTITSNQIGSIYGTISGGTGGQVGRISASSATGYLGFSAEL
jgi:hypothetical protein